MDTLRDIIEDSLVNFSEQPVLYGLASTGKVKFWQVGSGEDTNGLAWLFVRHGYEDGKKQFSKKQIKGKNIGRSNETTPFEQSESEAKSAWNKKRDKQYVDSKINLTLAPVLPLPMLAHEYGKRKHKIVFPCWAQPKLNGIRNIAEHTGDDTVRHSSRGGKIFNTLDHLSESIRHFGMLESGEKFDGEIFTPNLTFQEICAAVKREKEVNPNTALLEYHVYDYPNDEMDFEERIAMVIASIPENHANIKVVETVMINNEEELMEYHAHNMVRGYEGTMVRNSKGTYKYKHRSTDLLKLKDFMDEEFEIVGGTEGTGKALGQCVFKCKTSEGKEFDVRCVGANSVREEQWQNLDSYIGKMLTVKFQAWTDDMKPQFPVGLTIRDYE